MSDEGRWEVHTRSDEGRWEVHTMSDEGWWEVHTIGVMSGGRCTP